MIPMHIPAAPTEFSDLKESTCRGRTGRGILGVGTWKELGRGDWGVDLIKIDCVHV